MTTDALSRTFAALAHPARRSMLARLGRGEASVKELSRPLKMTAPAVTRHLKVLEASGLISRGRDAQWRPCRLETAPLVQAADWMASCRQEWEARFDRLESYLVEIQQAPPRQPLKPAKPVKPVKPVKARQRIRKGRP